MAREGSRDGQQDTPAGKDGGQTSEEFIKIELPGPIATCATASITPYKPQPGLPTKRGKRRPGASTSKQRRPRKEQRPDAQGPVVKHVSQELVDALPADLRSLIPIFKHFATSATFLDLRLPRLTFHDLTSTNPGLTYQNLGCFGVVASQILLITPVVKGELEAQDARQELYTGPKRSLLNQQKTILIQFVDTKASAKAGTQAVQRNILRRVRHFVWALVKFHDECCGLGKDSCKVLEEKAAELITDELDAGSSYGNNKPNPVPVGEMELKTVVNYLTMSDFYQNQIVARKFLVERMASYADFPPSIDRRVLEGIRLYKNIQKPYSHQAQALDAILRGEHVVVTTSTSSGKSLIYQLATLQLLANDSSSRAFYVCPTKALGQDQARSFKRLVASCPGLEWVNVVTYDGDTLREKRPVLRETAHVFVTNPDMLHVSVLPARNQWREVLSRLKYVIIDELHALDGSFGTHCGMVFRRLVRLCEAYGNTSVQFIACSATISNPIEHAASLFHTDNITLISRDGSPCGEKEVILWNPPLLDPNDPSIGRRHFFEESARIFCFLILKGIKTVAFARVRRTCELLFREVQLMLKDMPGGKGHSALSKVASYRGGYNKEERRRIEDDLFSGHLLGVVATNALELGVDIGGLDAVLHMGFPGISAMRQQSGRAGRRNRDSVSILVADNHALDQYYMAHPDVLFEKGFQDLTTDMKNEFIVESHLECAAHEKAIVPSSDCRWFGPHTREMAERGLHQLGDGTFVSFKSLPHKDVNIRSVDDDTFSVMELQPSGHYRLLEEMATERALFSLYQGAIYLHRGRSYMIFEISMDMRYALVKHTKVNWVTFNMKLVDVDPSTTEESKLAAPFARASHGKVEVKHRMVGYRRLDSKSLRLHEVVEVDSPPAIRQSRGAWIDVPTDLVRSMEKVSPDAIYTAVHTVAHCIVALVPIVMRITTEINTECRSPLAQRVRPARIIFYDTTSKGTAGVCQKLYQRFETLLRVSFDVMNECRCETGCPSCVFWIGCSQGNDLIDKKLGVMLLRGLLGTRDDGQGEPE